MRRISQLTAFAVASMSMLAGGCAQPTDGQSMASSNGVAVNNAQDLEYSCDNYEDLNASVKAEIANATNASGKTC
jgi:hypothetical protein